MLNIKSNNNKYLIGIDIGTSSTKMTVIDIHGNIIYTNSKDYKFNYLSNGFIQQDPNKWYGAVVYLLKDFVSNRKTVSNHILSIGISSQSNALVSIDKNGHLLHPAILYLDKRAIDICNSFTGTEKEKRIYEIGGSTLKPSYTGPQIAWLRKNNPDIYKNTYKFLTANGYIVFKLTGKFSQDYTQTGMTGIFDRDKKNWSEELLRYFNIKKNKLPEIYIPNEIVGMTSSCFKEDSSLPGGIPVIAGTLDVATSMLGSGVIDPGSCFIEMGSVINITVLTDNVIHDKNLQTYPSAVPGLNIIAGSVDGAGNTINWFLEQIYKGYGQDNKMTDREIFKKLGKQLIDTEIGAGNLIFLPFMTGMRTPRSDLNTKGAFLGLKISTRKIDIFRSILEGCAYSLKYNLDYILTEGTKSKKAIASGGASRDRFWMQLISDVLNITIKKSYYENSASLGSAMLAGIGLGVFKDFNQAVKTVCKYDYSFVPVKLRNEVYNKYYKQYKNFMKSLISELNKLEGI